MDKINDDKSKSDLSELFDCIRENEKEKRKRERDFMKLLGEPCCTRIENNEAILGYWRVPGPNGVFEGGVHRAQEGSNGWRYSTLQFISDSEIDALVKTQKAEGNAEAKKGQGKAK